MLKRMPNLLGYALVFLILVWLILRYTALASVIPYPKSIHIAGVQDPFLACFTEHSFLAQTDSVTMNRGFVAQPNGGFRMTQLTGVFALQSARTLFVVDTQGGKLKMRDEYYFADQPTKMRPLRKLDWLIARMCADGTL